MRTFFEFVLIVIIVVLIALSLKSKESQTLVPPSNPGEVTLSRSDMDALRQLATIVKGDSYSAENKSFLDLVSDVKIELDSADIVTVKGLSEEEIKQLDELLSLLPDTLSHVKAQNKQIEKMTGKKVFVLP